MDCIAHHLLALCAVSNSPHEWHSMDLEPLPRLVFFNVDHSLVDNARGGDDDIVLY